MLIMYDTINILSKVVMKCTKKVNNLKMLCKLLILVKKDLFYKKVLNLYK